MQHRGVLMSASADRNLLFGILALQMDFVSRDQLVAAMSAWVLDKARPLSDILAAQGALSPQRVGLLAALMAEHLKQHGDDPAQSLAAVSSLGSARKDLERIADADVQASLGVAASSHPVDADDPFATRPQPTVGTPTSIGLRFRILRPHAEGGLGRVSVAEDGELHREVALKEIKDKFADHPESRARFVVEAEITGGLEHPGIVPVYGLGAYADGRPFYAMRFIRGDSLKEAIQRFHSPGLPEFDSLEFRQLLGRFIDVCQAIAYAHSRNVLHRDLKPGNIMLGKYGETLVVDWGLAKALKENGQGSASLTDELPLTPASGSGTGETMPGEAIGTPEFMSPEQAAGWLDLIGPPTDIYSLGATLYAVLTGRSPMSGANVAEVLHKVQRGEYRSSRLVNPKVPPALAAVCDKAMALKPADRYGSALDFAADVEHWLADEPVTAWREPASARIWRWVRRHRTKTTTAAALVVAAAVGLGMLAIEKERARVVIANKEAETANERDEAKKQKSRTRAALDTMLSEDMVQRLGAQKELTKGQREFLQTALGYYREFAADAASDEEGRKLEADAHFRVAYLFSALEQMEEAVSAYRGAVPIYERLAADFPREPEYRTHLANCHNNLGNLLDDLGQQPAAEAEYRAALAIQRSLANEFPQIAGYRNDLANSQLNLGLLLYRRGQPASAEAEFRGALSVYQALAGDFPAVPSNLTGLAKTHSFLGSLLDDLGQRATAEVEFRAALAVRRRLVAEYPAVPDYADELAENHNNLGVLLSRWGRSAAAAAEYHEAVAIRKKLAVAFPAMPAYRIGLALTHKNLGVLLVGVGQRAAAEAEFRAAVSVYETLVANFPTVPEYRSELANSHNGLAILLAQQGKWTDAEAERRAALAIQERLTVDFPGESRYAVMLAGTYLGLGNLLSDTGDTTAAYEWHTKALKRLAPIVASNPQLVTARQFLRNVHWGLATDLTRLQRFAEALSEWDAALKLDDGRYRLYMRAGRAGCLARLGRATDAVREAGEVASDPAATGGTVYDCACSISVASAIPDNPAADDHAARAVELVRQAVAQGYTDIPHLLTNRDLAPLRRKADYADLLWDLADTPAARAKP